MSDDKSKQDYRDDAKIAHDEMYYWQQKWGVSHEDIESAIEKTESHSAKIIFNHLKSLGKIK